VRVRLLRDEYAHFERDPLSLMRQLDCLLPLHGHAKVEAWKALATARAWDTMVEELLQEHYDPAYLRSITRNFRGAAHARVVAIGSDEPAAYAAAARELTG
jgi:tRNA 2-selenouridine synthase